MGIQVGYTWGSKSTSTTWWSKCSLSLYLHVRRAFGHFNLDRIFKSVRIQHGSDGALIKRLDVQRRTPVHKIANFDSIWWCQFGQNLAKLGSMSRGFWESCWHPKFTKNDVHMKCVNMWSLEFSLPRKLTNQRSGALENLRKPTQNQCKNPETKKRQN